MTPITPIPVGSMILWGIITFSILVFLHEGGHFLAARMFGVNVHEFMLGLPGPALRWRSKKSGTAFGVTAIPLGGYVRIAGMEPGAEDELLGPALKVAAEMGRVDTTHLSERLGIPMERASSLLVTLADYMALEPATDDDVSYISQVTTTPEETPQQLIARVRIKTYRGLPTWKRVLVLSAGVGINILAAVLTFTVVLTFWGNAVSTLKLDLVQPKTAAAAAGIRPGDTLVVLNGSKLKGWTQVQTTLEKSKPGTRVSIVYRRDGTMHTTTAVLGSQDGHGFLGVRAATEYHSMPVLQAVKQAFALTGAVFVALGQFLAGIVHPRQFVSSLQNARSVVGISEMAAQAVQAGPLDYAWLVAFLSLSLGAMNILPIPPLDGGKVAVEGIERALGKPLKREWALAISAAGTLLLFSLIGYLVYADIARIAAGQ